ncbi:MAG: group II intron reverse transcriptase/maturase [Gammaproteobacteria bacterium]|nr:group II intron reverse transcriptase/maturase [Gammaproteobacteria bacterium]
MIDISKKKHRVHSLTGRITIEILQKAFKSVKRNRGAAGVDKQSIAMFETNLQANLTALTRDLKDGSYQAFPLRRVYIEKGGGKFRPLGIPAVRCRVAQETIRSLINPIFESLFHDNSHGFRNKRSCHSAMKQLKSFHRLGYRFLLDADVKGFFDNIPHKLIMGLLTREIADSNILNIIKKFLQAGVMEDGMVSPTRKGTPQGGVISPLLANIVLNHLDWRLEEKGYIFVRYADDFVVLTKTRRQVEKALEVVTDCIENDLGLQLSPEKTYITTFGQGFKYLGFYVSAFTVRMGSKAEERFKDKIRKLTIRSRNLDASVVLAVNRVISGTVRYFGADFATCLGQFNRLDRWIRRRIRSMKYKRIWKTDNRRFKNRYIHRMGFVTCREIYLIAS